LIPVNDHRQLISQKDTLFNGGLNLTVDEIICLLNGLAESQNPVNCCRMDLQGGGNHKVPHPISGKVERFVCGIRPVSHTQLIEISKQLLPSETQQGTDQGGWTKGPTAGNSPQTVEACTPKKAVENRLGLIIGGMPGQNIPCTFSLCKLSQTGVPKPPRRLLDAVSVI